MLSNLYLRSICDICWYVVLAQTAAHVATCATIISLVIILQEFWQATMDHLSCWRVTYYLWEKPCGLEYLQVTVREISKQTPNFFLLLATHNCSQLKIIFFSNIFQMWLFWCPIWCPTNCSNRQETVPFMLFVPNCSIMTMRLALSYQSCQDYLVPLLRNFILWSWIYGMT